MTDTQLEAIARVLLKRVDEINDIQSSAQMSLAFQAILAALKSVRDVGVQTEQRLDSYQAECHSLEAKIESIREICREHAPKQHDVLKMVQRALKSVRQASAGSPLSSEEENALRRKYAHFRAIAICARGLLTNEAAACESAAIKGRLLDAARVIDADLRSEVAQSESLSSDERTFDISDGRNRYRPCPQCQSDHGMGLVTKDRALAVQCMPCNFRGPAISGEPAAWKDKWAFDAWNDIPRFSDVERAEVLSVLGEFAEMYQSKTIYRREYSDDPFRLAAALHARLSAPNTDAAPQPTPEATK